MTRVTIARLGHQGDGIADGPIFAPRTLPGEEVEGDLVGNRIETPRIVTPSPNRTQAPCRHYKTCGGCGLQHVADPFIAEWKSEVVRAALVAQGLSVAIDAVHISPPRSRRRAVFSARRTKSGALLGFHAPKSEAITAIPDCRLLAPGIIAAFPALEALVEIGGSRKGVLRFAMTLSDNGPDIAATGGKPLDPALETALSRVVGDFGIARLTWAGELVAQTVPPCLHFGSVRVEPPPGAFLQATAEGEAALRSEVLESVAGARRVVDLFAGAGTFSLPMAMAAQVHAVEGDRALMDALDAAWRKATGLRQVSVETRDLFRQPLLPDELDRFDAAVIDPPRAGAEAQMHGVAASSLTRVAAVSCNPVSFARDARILTDAGFDLVRLVVVDQFRWSTHVELVAHFERARRPSRRA